MLARRWCKAVGLLIAALMISLVADGGTIYFSPTNGPQSYLVTKINSCTRSLDVAVFNITNSTIASAIVAAKGRGVTVRVVSDYGQSAGTYSKISYLKANGVTVHLLGTSTESTEMHDKYAVFDGASMETGSYNWTGQANTTNYENADFMSDSSTVSAYETNFNYLWSLSHH